jgi:hypothetical protein
MYSLSASLQLGSESPLRPVPPLTCAAWRTWLDDLVRLESGAGQYRCRWSVRRRYCTATRKPSSTATSKCGLGLAPGQVRMPSGLCSGQIHRLAHDAVSPALSAPHTFTMDMDTWTVAVLGKGSVGKTALLQQVRPTTWANSRDLADWSPLAYHGVFCRYGDLFSSVYSRSDLYRSLLHARTLTDVRTAWRCCCAGALVDCPLPGRRGTLRRMIPGASSFQ